MESFDSFDFATLPLFSQPAGNSPDLSPIDFSTAVNTAANNSAANMTRPFQLDDLASPLEDEWDQVSDNSFPETYGAGSLLDDNTVAPAMMPQQYQWNGNMASIPVLASQTRKSSYSSAQNSSPRSTHTTEIAGWTPTEEDVLPKRTRATGRDDVKAACWKSPLCPAFGKEGEHPDPSTCEGGCAPYLFSDSALKDLLYTESSPEFKVEDSSSPDSQPLPKEKKTRGDSSSKATEASKPDNKKKSKNKRSSSEESTSEPAKPAQKTSGRQPHNEIERKYRESINSHLESLKNVIPAFQQQSASAPKDPDIEDLATTPKPSKGAILAGAVAHIKKQRREKQQLEQENALLKQQVKALQALVKCEDCSLMHYAMGLNLNNNANPACASA